MANELCWIYFEGLRVEYSAATNKDALTTSGCFDNNSLYAIMISLKLLTKDPVTITVAN